MPGATHHSSRDAALAGGVRGSGRRGAAHPGALVGALDEGAHVGPQPHEILLDLLLAARRLRRQQMK